MGNLNTIIGRMMLSSPECVIAVQEIVALAAMACGLTTAERIEVAGCVHNIADLGEEQYKRLGKVIPLYVAEKIDLLRSIADAISPAVARTRSKPS